MLDHIFKFAVAVTPIVVAAIAYNQFRVAKDNLRLSLYSRRFEIYVSAIKFYQALMRFKGDNDFETIHHNFIRSFRESRFLFHPKYQIYEILNEIMQKSQLVIWHETEGKNNPDPMERVRSGQAAADVLLWLGTALLTLEERMREPMAFFDQPLHKRIFYRATAAYQKLSIRDAGPQAILPRPDAAQ